MRHTTLTNPSLQDTLGERLRIAIIASVLVNIILWHSAAAIARHPAHWDLKPVEITRVIIDNKGKRIEKKITKKQIQKKVAQIHKEIQKPKPPPKPMVRRPVPVVKPKPIQVAQKPPEGAHHRIITALPDKNAPPKPDDHTALAGGNADLGKPIEKQAPGNATTNPPVPPKKVETPSPTPAPPAPMPKPTPAPPAPMPAPAPAPEPVKEEPPKPKGPTKDAEPADTIKPEIPDDLKHGDFKAFVRVKVEIDEDGSFTPILRTSSGNDEIDRRVLEALKKWKWKPALKDGVPVKSVKLFKFEFEVE